MPRQKKSFGCASLSPYIKWVTLKEKKELFNQDAIASYHHLFIKHVYNYSAIQIRVRYVLPTEEHNQYDLTLPIDCFHMFL